MSQELERLPWAASSEMLSIRDFFELFKILFSFVRLYGTNNLPLTSLKEK